jgi:hypothetical protein
LQVLGERGGGDQEADIGVAGAQEGAKFVQNRGCFAGAGGAREETHGWVEGLL